MYLRKQYKLKIIKITFGEGEIMCLEGKKFKLFFSLNMSIHFATIRTMIIDVIIKYLLQFFLKRCSFFLFICEKI